jgi:hypothetical protein
MKINDREYSMSLINFYDTAMSYLNQTENGIVTSYERLENSRERIEEYIHDVREFKEELFTEGRGFVNLKIKSNLEKVISKLEVASLMLC